MPDFILGLQPSLCSLLSARHGPQSTANSISTAAAWKVRRGGANGLSTHPTASHAALVVLMHHFPPCPGMSPTTDTALHVFETGLSQCSAGIWGEREQGHASRRHSAPLYSQPALCSATSTWSAPATTGDAPRPRLGHAICAWGRKVLVHGGMANMEIFDDIHTLDLGASWPRVGVEQSSPAVHALALPGATPASTCRPRSTDTMAWSKLECKGTGPPARSGHAACVLCNKYFVVHGGLGPGPAGFAALDDIWVLNLCMWGYDARQSACLAPPSARAHPRCPSQRH